MLRKKFPVLKSTDLITLLPDVMNMEVLDFKCLFSQHDQHMKGDFCCHGKMDLV